MRKKTMNIVRLLLSFILLSTLAYASSIKYTPFVSEQLKLVKQMNEDNATKESVQALLHTQNRLYENAVDELMVNKEKYIKNITLYESEIFSLKKVIAINKRAGNKYAIYRDETALQIYRTLRSQNKMIKDVLLGLNAETREEFETLINTYVLQNQKNMQKLYEVNYDEILALDVESKNLKIAKENIYDFQYLREVNADLISYLYKFNAKMYRLNKYSKYHMISLAIYINSLGIVEMINPLLEQYGLNVIKLLSMLVLIALVYFFRRFVYVFLEKNLVKIDLLNAYALEIIEKLKKSLEALIIIVNINMVIYVYNDFSSVASIAKIFNMLYGFYFTLIVYKVVNTIAKIRLNELSTDKSNIKNDLVNVGIKIVNFIILIMGLLIVLFFAGVNLTAVLSGLGIGGFAVAFAAKDTISNFFGTLSILFSDVFSQGDWIEIDGHEGVVVEIGLRVTTIRTFDNALIAIPNGTFASKDVKNWDKRILGRRIKMHVGVKYDSKSADIKNAIAEIRTMLDKHPEIATKATKYSHHNDRTHTAKLVSKDDLEGVKNNLLVYLDEFSDSSINILIYCFTKSVKWAEWLDTKEDVMHNIMAILEKNNLEFAFPSLSIYNENN